MSQAAGIAAALILAAAWIGLGLGDEGYERHLDDISTAVAALGATGLCVWAGLRTAGDLRRFWWLLAAACGAWALGEIAWASYRFAVSGEVPVPSWADAAHLAAIPLAAAALLSHPGMERGRTGRFRPMLDGLGVGIALLFLTWLLVLEPLWSQTDLTGLGRLVTVAYPFGDVAVVTFVLLVIRGTAAADRLPLWCLLAGLLAITVSDSAYGYLTQFKGYDAGSLGGTAWVAGYVAIALGAYYGASEAKPVRASGHRPTPWSILASFVPVLVALTVAAVKVELGHELDRVAWTIALVLAGVVLLRQALLAVDMFAPGRPHEAKVSDRLVAAVGGPISESNPADPAPTRTGGP
jgi:hypothetical protein